MTETALQTKSFVALAPSEMPQVQAEIATWCQAKIVELGRDLADARKNLRQAKAMLWAWKPWERTARKLEQRMVYYAKIKAAVKAGFLIVPNFPAEIIAVKVEKRGPRFDVGTWPSEVNQATPDLALGPGQGRYVDETMPHFDVSYTTPPTPQHPQGQFIRKSKVDRDSGYGETPDFPTTLVKPVVLEATQHAMALRIFDQIGLVNQDGTTTSRQHRRSDPIVVGQIFDGSAPKAWGKKLPEKRVTFFIAWWLDTRML